jgi:hypothetical protein
MDDLGEKVAAHDATLTQMNERLGSIEARLTGMDARMATVSELRTWSGLIIALLGVAVGIILKYG